MICVECAVEFSSKMGAKFCNKTCKRRWHSKKKTEVTCPCCMVTRVLSYDSARANKSGVCSSCATDRFIGEGNPRWKGGQKWIQGRFGRDPNGLSWKVQRKLAWERDDYTCRRCGKAENGWRPDVHHVAPYRVSRSHTLDNLICLCRKCHLQAEPQVQGAWGGATFKSTRLRTKPYCTECDRPIQGTPYTQSGACLCRICKGRFLISRAQGLRQDGVSITEIARMLGVSYMGASYYSRGLTSSAAVVPASGIEPL